MVFKHNRGVHRQSPLIVPEYTATRYRRFNTARQGFRTCITCVWQQVGLLTTPSSGVASAPRHACGSPGSFVAKRTQRGGRYHVAISARTGGSKRIVSFRRGDYIIRHAVVHKRVDYSRRTGVVNARRAHCSLEHA